MKFVLKIRRLKHRLRGLWLTILRYKCLKWASSAQKSGSSAEIPGIALEKSIVMSFSRAFICQNLTSREIKDAYRFQTTRCAIE